MLSLYVRRERGLADGTEGVIAEITFDTGRGVGLKSALIRRQGGGVPAHVVLHLHLRDDGTARLRAALHDVHCT